jgi:hypothetical protein
MHIKLNKFYYGLKVHLTFKGSLAQMAKKIIFYNGLWIMLHGIFLPQIFDYISVSAKFQVHWQWTWQSLTFKHQIRNTTKISSLIITFWQMGPLSLCFWKNTKCNIWTSLVGALLQQAPNQFLEGLVQGKWSTRAPHQL